MDLMIHEMYRCTNEYSFLIIKCMYIDKKADKNTIKILIPVFMFALNHVN